MSNREVKYLFENWRKFIVKEAAEGGSAPLSIYDFDNTVVSTKDFLGEAAGASNLYMTYLNLGGIRRLYAAMLENIKILPAAQNLKNDLIENPKSTYIFSMVSGVSFGSTREKFIEYYNNRDPKFLKFCNLILGVDISALQAFDGGGEDMDYDEGDSERYDDNYYGDMDESLTEAKLPETAEEIVDAYFTFPESGKKVDPTEVKMAIKKKLIVKICKKQDAEGQPIIPISPSKIIVGNNLAKSAEMGGVEKGTSGKVKDASVIASKHPSASAYRIYDNSGIMLAQVKKGVEMHKSQNLTPEQQKEIAAVDAKIASATSQKEKAAQEKRKEYVVAQALNIELYKVGEQGPERFYGASLSHGGTGEKSPIRTIQVLSNQIINPILGYGITDKENKDKFVEFAKKFPEIAALINTEENLKKIGKKAEIPGVQPFNPEGMTTQQILKFAEELEGEVPKFLNGFSEIFTQSKTAKRKAGATAPADVPQAPAPETDKPEEKPVKTKGTAKKTLERANKHLDETGNPLFENRLFEMVVKNLKKKGILR
jgi:hypothetical protein